jgi:hypothetical protein
MVQNCVLGKDTVENLVLLKEMANEHRSGAIDFYSSNHRNKKDVLWNVVKIEVISQSLSGH